MSDLVLDTHLLNLTRISVSSKIINLSLITVRRKCPVECFHLIPLSPHQLLLLELKGFPGLLGSFKCKLYVLVTSVLGTVTYIKEISNNLSQSINPVNYVFNTLWNLPRRLKL